MNCNVNIGTEADLNWFAYDGTKTYVFRAPAAATLNVSVTCIQDGTTGTLKLDKYVQAVENPMGVVFDNDGTSFELFFVGSYLGTQNWYYGSFGTADLEY